MDYPKEKLDKIIDLLRKERMQFPYHVRGIKIDYELIEATMNVLFNSPNFRMEQNCKNSLRDYQEEGLDYFIKVKRDSDIRTANIISDELKRIGVLSITSEINNKTGRKRKVSTINDDWL